MRKEIVCPECDGEKYFDRMTNLSYEGDSSWTQEPCETCHGNGWVYDEQGEQWSKTINEAIDLLITIDEGYAEDYNHEFSELVSKAVTDLCNADDILKGGTK